MHLPETTRKVAEARFFLECLRKEAKRTSGDREPFRHFLSACLNAARGVTFVLQKEAGSARRNRYQELISALPPDEAALLDFMNGQRVAETHRLGAEYEVGERRIPVDPTYEDERGRGQVFYTAPANDFRVEPAAEIIAPSYAFKVGDELIDVTEAFERYLDVVERLVRDVAKV